VPTQVSTVFNTLAEILWRKSSWKEQPRKKVEGARKSLGDLGCELSIRDIDVVLGPCHGRGLPWRELGLGGRVQVVNYLQGMRSITLKAELGTLLRRWAEDHPDEEPFTPLTYILYPLRVPPRLAAGQRSSGLLGRYATREGDEREDFLWESELRARQGIDNVWAVKRSAGSKGNAVQVVEGGPAVVAHIDSAYEGSAQPVAVQKYVQVAPATFTPRLRAVLGVRRCWRARLTPRSGGRGRTRSSCAASSSTCACGWCTARLARTRLAF
jgi:hypothetical protein